MLKKISERKETWKTIFLFLTIVLLLTSPFHYAVVNLYPSRIYVGAIMWCPAIAAFITLKIKGHKISSLNWNWGNWKYIQLSYLIPALYGLITYILIWFFGFGSLTNNEAITAVERLSADLNGNNVIDVQDFTALRELFLTESCEKNITGSCLIDIFDYNLLYTAYISQ